MLPEFSIKRYFKRISNISAKHAGYSVFCQTFRDFKAILVNQMIVLSLLYVVRPSKVDCVMAVVIYTLKVEPMCSNLHPSVLLSRSTRKPHNIKFHRFRLYYTILMVSLNIICYINTTDFGERIGQSQNA